MFVCSATVRIIISAHWIELALCVVHPVVASSMTHQLRRTTGKSYFGAIEA